MAEERLGDGAAAGKGETQDGLFLTGEENKGYTETEQG